MPASLQGGRAGAGLEGPGPRFAITARFIPLWRLRGEAPVGTRITYAGSSATPTTRDRGGLRSSSRPG